MARLGAPIVFTVPESHLTRTVRGSDETVGSVHHPEMTQFAGIIGRLRENQDGPVADIVIFAPGREPKWVNGVVEGEGAGQFALADVENAGVTDND